MKSYQSKSKLIGISWLLGLLLILLCYLFVSGQQFILVLSPIDTNLFLFLNHHHNAFWDIIMYRASDKLFWFPFYALLIYILWRHFGRECWKPLLTIGLLILSSDQISSHLIKNAVKRPRPSHEATLIHFIHLSKAGPGGLYGFVSSHAANAFALTVFLSLLLNRSYRLLHVVLFSWALLVSYSRVYNGVHYPLDVITAALIGMLLGWIFYFSYQLIFLKPTENER